MRVCLVNDVCWIGEALSKYLPCDVTHIRRSRGAVSKTLGITAKILLARADLYHVMYLLQDAYLCLKMKKRPIVGHACGSDVRDTLHSKKWGWIVKHNLEDVDYVLSCQPTLLPQIREYTDRTEYFPTPFDPELFNPSPLPDHNGDFTLLYSSPVDFRVKGTDKVLEAVSLVKQPVTLVAIRYGVDLERTYELSRKLGVRVKWIEKQPHDEMAVLYHSADVVLGNFGVGQLDSTVIEAMGSGRPAVHHLAHGFFREVPLGNYGTIEEFADDIERLLMDRKAAEAQVKRQLAYVQIHKADHAAERLMKIYSQLL